MLFTLIIGFVILAGPKAFAEKGALDLARENNNEAVVNRGQKAQDVKNAEAKAKEDGTEDSENMAEIARQELETAKTLAEAAKEQLQRAEIISPSGSETSSTGKQPFTNGLPSPQEVVSPAQDNASQSKGGTSNSGENSLGPLDQGVPPAPQSEPPSPPTELSQKASAPIPETADALGSENTKLRSDPGKIVGDNTEWTDKETGKKYTKNTEELKVYEKWFDREVAKGDGNTPPKWDKIPDNLKPEIVSPQQVADAGKSGGAPSASDSGAKGQTKGPEITLHTAKGEWCDGCNSFKDSQMLKDLKATHGENLKTQTYTKAQLNSGQAPNLPSVSVRMPNGDMHSFDYTTFGPNYMNLTPLKTLK